MEAVFSDPLSTTSFKDYVLQDRMVNMVNETPAGESIYFTIWNLSRRSFADAVVNAKARGVKVYAVANGQNYGGTEFDRVKAALGPDFKVCNTPSPDGPIQSCISNRTKSYLHSKFWAFSKTGTLSNVVVVGTPNMTNHGNEYNDMLIVGGDQAMYDGYLRYFDDLFNQRKNNDYTISPNGTVRSPASLTTSFFSPRADSNGGSNAQTSTDTVALAIKPLAGGPDCRVRVMQRFWDSSRSPVTNQLIRLQKAGCDLTVLTDDADSTTLNSLRTAGIPVLGVKTKQPNGVTTKLHGKMFILEGTYNGVPNTRLLHTGSHNLYRSSLRSADETLVQTSYGPVIDQYHAYYAKIWATGYPPV